MVSVPALARFDTLALGVTAGLAAALASAVSYLVSRHHGNRGDGGSLRLLVQAHAVMGIASLPLCWWLTPAAWPADRRWLVPLAGSVLTYLGGQAGVFATLKQMPASRVAPLLGLKLVMLAAFVSLQPGTGLTPPQWLAVGMSVTAAAILQRGGRGSTAIAVRPLVMLLATCLSFAVSDLCIIGLIDGLAPSRDASGGAISRLHAGGLAMAVTYALCGGLAGIALASLPAVRPRDGSDRNAACQYAVAWLGGMAALYVCFGLVGAVLGNVLQSTRGVMAIVIGAALARAGWHDLEERVDRATFLRRVAAGGLMIAAIAVYVTGTAGW